MVSEGTTASLPKNKNRQDAGKNAQKNGMDFEISYAEMHGYEVVKGRLKPDVINPKNGFKISCKRSKTEGIRNQIEGHYKLIKFFSDYTIPDKIKYWLIFVMGCERPIPGLFEYEEGVKSFIIGKYSLTEIFEPNDLKYQNIDDFYNPKYTKFKYRNRKPWDECKTCGQCYDSCTCPAYVPNEQIRSRVKTFLFSDEFNDYVIEWFKKNMKELIQLWLVKNDPDLKILAWYIENKNKTFEYLIEDILNAAENFEIKFGKHGTSIQLGMFIFKPYSGSNGDKQPPEDYYSIQIQMSHGDLAKYVKPINIIDYSAFGPKLSQADELSQLFC